jgi:hypothetical protein
MHMKTGSKFILVRSGYFKGKQSSEIPNNKISNNSYCSETHMIGDLAGNLALLRKTAPK